MDTILDWRNEGPWATYDGNHWFAEASTLDHLIDPMLPECGMAVSELKFVPEYDSEGDIISWEANFGGCDYTIWND